MLLLLFCMFVFLFFRSHLALFQEKIKILAFIKWKSLLARTKQLLLHRLSIIYDNTCATGVQNSLKRTGHLNRTPLSLFQVIIVATLAVMMVLLKGLVLNPCKPRAKGSNR